MLDRERYQAAAREAAAAAEQGDRAGAIRRFEEILKLDLPETDRAMMCLNLATLHDQLGEERKALRWFERAVEHEKDGLFAAGQMAAWLHRNGKVQEARHLTEKLLRRPNLSKQDREGLERNLAALGGPTVR